MDFMDFSDDGCMNMFTIDQTKVMRALFAKNNARNSFLSAYQCDSTLAQAGPVYSSTPADTVIVVVVVVLSLLLLLSL